MDVLINVEVFLLGVIDVDVDIDLWIFGIGIGYMFLID